MANLRYNHCTVLHVELGKNSIASEESGLRASVTRPTMPDNTTMLPFPYPKQYKVDRWQRLACIVNADLSVEYLLVFVHHCLAWKHARQYTITQEEYETLCDRMSSKMTDQHTFTYTHSDFVTIDRDFALPCLSTIGE